jgi:hypothetical protein
VGVATQQVREERDSDGTGVRAVQVAAGNALAITCHKLSRGSFHLSAHVGRVALEPRHCTLRRVNQAHDLGPDVTNETVTQRAVHSHSGQQVGEGERRQDVAALVQQPLDDLSRGGGGAHGSDGVAKDEEATDQEPTPQGLQCGAGHLAVLLHKLVVDCLAD